MDRMSYNCYLSLLLSQTCHYIDGGKQHDGTITQLIQETDLMKNYIKYFYMRQLGQICHRHIPGVGGAVDSKSALRSAATLLSRVRALSQRLWPGEGLKA
ncbi:hypothetical protein PoB_004261800 [Plakobranchus ocellatus]|uniref:Uncharacterized protein n=1 Tax=Plakobranchus ocellatus TaxID=259542 RepID=A0AAV4BAE5_9GAST|nr:hypothetical protein PoB_004261800 [Plakobranchus ocellatus]